MAKIKYDPMQEGILKVNVLYSQREEQTQFYVELLPVRRKYNLTNILGENKAHTTIKHLSPGRYKVVLRGDILELDIFSETEKSSGEFSQIIEVDLKPNDTKVINFNLGSEISVEFMVYLDNQAIEKAAITIPQTQMTKFIKNSKPVIFALKPDLYNILIEIQSFKINRYIKVEPEDEIINFYVSSREIMFSEWNAELKKGEVDAVMQSAISLLEKHPEYVDINFFVGRLNCLKKDYKKAYIYFQSALKHNNRFLDAYIYTALLLIRTNNLSQALPYLRNAKKLNLFLNENRYNAALEALKIGRASEAESLVAKAFEYNPFLLEICRYSLDDIPFFVDYTNISKDYFHSGNLEKAKESIKKLLKLQPKYVDMLYILGLIEYYQNNYEDAVSSLAKASSINPNYVQALILLGKIHYKMEKLTKAQEYFFRTMTIDKDNRIAKIFITKIKAKISSKPPTDEIEITYS